MTTLHHPPAADNAAPPPDRPPAPPDNGTAAPAVLPSPADAARAKAFFVRLDRMLAAYDNDVSWLEEHWDGVYAAATGEVYDTRAAERETRAAEREGDGADAADPDP